MTILAYTVSKIASICGGVVHHSIAGDPVIHDLLIDSRCLIHPENCLFIALVSDRNDGHKYIDELYEKGVRCFMVSDTFYHLTISPFHHFPDASFILVPDTLKALQNLGSYHRRQFNIPVIGITGSNGKTIVKEWLFQLLNHDYKIIRSPKSYNSQIGVPLSVWKMESSHNLAIFEAGISKPGEMEHLEPIIQPTLGIFTNIGHAHDEHFVNQHQKVKEKLRLFAHTQTLIYCSDYELITESIKADASYHNLRTFTWGLNHEADVQITSVQKGNGQTRINIFYQKEANSFTIPFTDEASIENAIHCVSTLLLLNYSPSNIRYSVSLLVPIAMRLELKEAINRCSLINDSYNSDINSLSIALDFLNQQNQQKKKTVILSDILQTGRDKEELYREIAWMLQSKHIDRIIGIGRDLMKFGHHFPMQKNFFTTTDEFLERFPISTFQQETILLKGARIFEFEKISQLLQQKAHETVMEVNLDALIHNLNFYRSGLQSGTKIMAMVKAFSYGSGSYEIANALQFHQVDYLTVAYADEGVELRKAGIHLPIMVMSPEEQSLDTLLKFNLEPEIYNLHILHLLEEAIARNVTSIQQEVRIHIKLDTGMHRLGFVEEELDTLIEQIQKNPDFRVQSVFSHLAASEDPDEDEFTRLQISRFEFLSQKVARSLNYPILRHICNSAGICRFPDAHFNMVRLGIGLYGIGNTLEEQSQLQQVSSLKTVITQIKHIPAGDTIGYNRKGKAEKNMIIAIVPIGYADGLDRRLGNGVGKLYIQGKPAPIVGNICMDLTMIDITDFSNLSIDITEGTEVIIFNTQHPITELSQAMGTIPYEVLTGISRRVKRIYYYE
ncbi:MAG: bifunctional UDP-N-acetylmuramoyl-tripeptide:D-alanyl-D-alanine ligase/alanine racemase [Bacteroidales bacterium]|nr:bifunctional UDP-N-acetylmuramoyl-tripeptide:D-alanyl-D-alanine ligase/alanine racemase [Bacteroidales bacterium]